MSNPDYSSSESSPSAEDSVDFPIREFFAFDITRADGVGTTTLEIIAAR